jgi:hypothetical protein
MLPYLFGLGCMSLLLCRSITFNGCIFSDSSRLQIIANLLAFGVVLNHSIVLLVGDIKLSLILGCVFSVIGILKFITFGFTKPKIIILFGWFAIGIILYCICLYIVFNEPLYGWDARSIWFFHAKMIFFNASVNAGGNWSLPSIGFSHPDYPALIPILAAQIAFVAGYWNEYLPKLSLVALFIPVILCLISILSSKWWHIFLIFIPLLFTQEWLSNGYMDGYLALNIGLATFFWGRWLDERNRTDLMSGIIFVGVVLNLKNEGMLYSLIILFLISFFLLVKKNKFQKSSYLKFSENIFLFMISISGLFLWGMKKSEFNLQNDLQLGLKSFYKFYERLTDGSLLIIFRKLYVTDNLNLSFGILLLSLVITLRMGKRPTSGSLFCMFTGFLYFGGIVSIYLVTPYDLILFHLPTGNRTMLPVHIILIAAAFSLFRWSNRNYVEIHEINELAHQERTPE